MNLKVYEDKFSMGAAAAADGAAAIRAALDQRGAATIVVATGASQFEMLSQLAATPDVDWSRVTGFHLDEYAGLADTHPGSFRRYLRERFVQRLPRPLRDFHYLNGEHDCRAECERVGAILSQTTVDVAFVGIGENGHLAFNDPPADFATTRPYHVVQLDDRCRLQQFNEGWFDTIEEVPTEAISMSVREILRSRLIVCTVPDARKAEAVRDAVEGPVDPRVPASILQTHAATALYLDRYAASLLSDRGLRELPPDAARAISAQQSA
ncbi:MAG: glucosamine-6-phosphate deaminase [Pirellulales bacterium]|nr:glucosamine-6-phosphate deaminase [Pirellulales bacterium]